MKVHRTQLRHTGPAKPHLHLLLTDLAACYDCIPFTIIQLCVQRMGLPPVFLRLIRGMQQQQHRAVKVNGQPPSDAFLLTGGLAQGCGLSCILLVCITAAIITFTQDRKDRGTANCQCQNPLLRHPSDTKIKLGPPNTEPQKKQCKCAPYTIIGPCMHAQKCATCKIKADPECKALHWNRCIACMGFTKRPSQCTHPQCPTTCKHRRIELWQQYCG